MVHEQNMNSNLPLRFSAFHINSLVKECPFFEGLSAYKRSRSHVDWCKSCIHLRSLNIRHFGLVEGMALKSAEPKSHLME
jgi:hypothetical protein